MRTRPFSHSKQGPPTYSIDHTQSWFLRTKAIYAWVVPEDGLGPALYADGDHQICFNEENIQSYSSSISCHINIRLVK